ncbi:MAG: hypothetical protein MHPSP_000632 [Paramarteilia canceri]
MADFLLVSSKKSEQGIRKARENNEKAQKGNTGRSSVITERNTDPARRSLTSVFGMGTGVASGVWSPRYSALSRTAKFLILTLERSKREQLFCL